jgi:carbon monoxide dehydrogenase subunit G
MELKGEYTLPAGVAVVWNALNDPELLAACIPGCESVERVSSSEMKAVVAVEIGPFKSRFTGTIKTEDGNPPRRWTLRGDGAGRPSGTAHGVINLELVEAAGRTTVNFVGSAEVGGKLAELAESAIERTAREMADTFFARLASELDDSGDKWVDELDHSMAAVQMGDEPSEDVVIDKAEVAGETAKEIEAEIEWAAGRQFLGGPYAWGLLALAGLILLWVLMY